MRKEYLWLAVTPDAYELPIVVCDTAEQLGAVYGLSRNTVISNVRQKADGSRTGHKFVRVRIEE